MDNDPLSELRAQLAQQLHDGPIQVLTAVNLRLGMLRRRVDPGVASQISEVEQMVGLALSDLREQMDGLAGEPTVEG